MLAPNVQNWQQKIIMNLCTIHGIRNKFVDEFFTLLQLHLLLEPNCLPNSYYASKTLIQKLGLDYKKFMHVLKGVCCFKGTI